MMSNTAVNGAGETVITRLKMGKTLRLILGDQLNHKHSWFESTDTNVIYCMMEMRQETDYVRHHIQKIMAFFHAMRSFADILTEQGHELRYLRIGDTDNAQSLEANLDALIKTYNIERFEYILPDEYRLDQQLKTYCDKLEIDSGACDSEHFICERDHLARFFESRKTFVMEPFYRDIRKRLGIMIDDGEPLGGQWNYDKDNRQALDKGQTVNEMEAPSINLASLFDEIKEAGIEYIGEVRADRFGWICNRQDGLKWLDRFLEEALENFGNYQDAMHSDYKYLFHSRLSFLLNVKLISPLEVVNKTLAYWDENKHIDISQVEGFIRQIIGWREYMRGIYWAHMPSYAEMNHFGHDRKLPGWFWTGETGMNCMKHAIRQSLDSAYAHHIQRLMITGNFALLAGTDPDELDAWYLGIYIDAIEWVEITNTRGMSQFADGGIVGTKPYISSASYINKMSNYCSGCKYNHREKTGDKACPFNSLYWRFYELNRDTLSNNPRVAMMYRTWDRMGEEKQKAYLEKAESYISNIEDL